MHTRLTTVLVLVLALVGGPMSTAQETQQEPQSPPEAVVYDAIEFPDLPFDSSWLEVSPEGLPAARLHYLEAGDPAADPILLIHGQPTWSYLWREVIPHLAPHGRVIAVDLVGMGRSSKPAIDYRYRDHIRYLEAFIETLGLEHVTLVVHDWGSGLGFDYASRHEDNVKAIAFMEAMIPPTIPFESIDAMPPGPREAFGAFRTPGVGEALLMGQNAFVEQFLPGMIVRRLGDEELDAYRAPYPTPAERRPIWRWPNELPIGGEPADTTAVVLAYYRWLERTELPMLHLWVTPGVANPEAAVVWAREHIANLTSVYLGEGLHFVQEDHPAAIGQEIVLWLTTAVEGDLAATRRQ